MHRLAVICAAALGMLAALPAGAEAPQDTPAPHCVLIAQIDHTQVVDDRSILFFLKGGEVLRNTLQDKCVGLKMSDRGFTYVVRADEVCGNLQTIRVNDTGEICNLGPFTVEPGKH